MIPMVDLTLTRKNKITLSDYNYRRDIENRLLMAQLSPLDLSLLEEILFSSIQIPIKKLAKTLEITEETLLGSIQKFVQAGLIKVDKDNLLVDKEMRKYFEAQFQKFDEDFRPDMEFLQSLLKKVPIHVLPVWYAISRTSNNIFESIVEKYLLTPQIFQRYLMELHFTDPTWNAIVQDVFRSPTLKVYSKDLMDKYALSKEQFEEILLQLEFHFLCCVGYERNEEELREIVTPFQEWKDYLLFLKNTVPAPLPKPEKVIRFRASDYAFVQDLSELLLVLQKKPFSLKENNLSELAAQLTNFPEDISYLEHMVRKARLVKLAEVIDGKLQLLEKAHGWLEMRLENKALFLYRHPFNKISSVQLPHSLSHERAIREAEKSVVRIAHTGWIVFDEFIKGVIAPIGEKNAISLRKIGKTWKYALPEYNADELALIKATIFEWLFETGITAIGTYEDKECFTLTPLGQSLFG